VSVDNGIGHKHEVNVDTLINTGERTVRFLTDRNGYRIGANPVIEPTIRILAIGDSFLEALAVEYEQTITAHLEQMMSLNTGEVVKVVNTGVADYNPNHYLLTVRAELPRTHYDLVVVFCYLANDMTSSRTDRFPPRNPARRHRFRLPNTFNKREIIDATLYPVNDFLEERSHLFILFKNCASILLARMGLTASYFSRAMKTSSANSPAWDNTVAILADIKVEADNKDTPIAFVFLPATYQVDKSAFRRYVAMFNIDPAQVDLYQPQRILGEKLISRGITVFDTTAALGQAHADGVKDLYGQVDTHLGPNGHKVVAAYLAPKLLRLLKDKGD